MKLDIRPVFFTLVRLHGGPAPVRRYLPDLIKVVWERKINPGRVFDLVLPLNQVAEGYRAMNERRAIKTLLRSELLLGLTLPNDLHATHSSSYRC
jgi:threonine dehydrogenase-like Zn-dependent dehydrogenase